MTPSARPPPSQIGAVKASRTKRLVCDIAGSRCSVAVVLAVVAPRPLARLAPWADIAAHGFRRGVLGLVLGHILPYQRSGMPDVLLPWWCQNQVCSGRWLILPPAAWQPRVNRQSSPARWPSAPVSPSGTVSNPTDCASSVSTRVVTVVCTGCSGSHGLPNVFGKGSQLGHSRPAASFIVNHE